MGVLDAMPSTNLKPEGEEAVLEADRIYRTTYMFSATMPPAVERLARKYLRRPVVINIGSAGKATDNVQQIVIMAKDNDKPRLLVCPVQSLHHCPIHLPSWCLQIEMWSSKHKVYMASFQECLGNASAVTHNLLLDHLWFHRAETEALNWWLQQEEQLEAVDERRAIVFVNTKRNCDVVSKHLDHLGFRCIVLHGGKTQVPARSSGLPASRFFLCYGHCIF